jgi:nickel transport protein
MNDKWKAIKNCFNAFQAISLVVVLSLFFANAPIAYAHKVYLFAWVEGNTVYTESYFSGKKKVIGGLIKVLDSSDKEILKGKTNEKGEFAFKIPQDTDLRIVLESSMGHRAEYLLKVDEIKGIDTIPETKTGNSETKPISSPDNAVNMEQIRPLIEQVLDSRLKPISKRLSRIEEEKGPGLIEIIGGIGFIFGIMGVVLYFRSKKKNN